MIPSLTGLVLAFAAWLYAVLLGLDEDRAFYPTVLVVVASYYVLFAVIGGGSAVFPESSIAVAFVAVASAGFKRNSWFLVAGLAAHGLLDGVHGIAVSNAGVPAWWPSFCLAFDVTMAGLLALSMWRRDSRRAI